MVIGDDIGWADFSYNNGTAATPRIKEWTEAAGTVVLQDFHTGGTVCSPTRATVLTGGKPRGGGTKAALPSLAACVQAGIIFETVSTMFMAARI